MEAAEAKVGGGGGFADPFAVQAILIPSPSPVQCPAGCGRPLVWPTLIGDALQRGYRPPSFEELEELSDVEKRKQGKRRGRGGTKGGIAKRGGRSKKQRGE
jgi:hypothetical protein